jgi:hypothetical protein
MRVRAAAFVFFALPATCSGKQLATANPESLQMLDHLASEQNSFGIVLDAKTGKPLAAFRLNNPIRTAISDGQGGWYIDGGFIRINDFPISGPPHRKSAALSVAKTTARCESAPRDRPSVGFASRSGEALQSSLFSRLRARGLTNIDRAPSR